MMDDTQDFFKSNSIIITYSNNLIRALNLTKHWFSVLDSFHKDKRFSPSKTDIRTYQVSYKKAVQLPITITF